MKTPSSPRPPWTYRFPQTAANPWLYRGDGGLPKEYDERSVQFMNLGSKTKMSIIKPAKSYFWEKVCKTHCNSPGWLPNTDCALVSSCEGVKWRLAWREIREDYYKRTWIAISPVHIKPSIRWGESVHVSCSWSKLKRGVCQVSPCSNGRVKDKKVAQRTCKANQKVQISNWRPVIIELDCVDRHWMQQSRKGVQQQIQKAGLRKWWMTSIEKLRCHSRVRVMGAW